MTEPRTRSTEPVLKDAGIAAIIPEDRQCYTFLADTMPLIIWTARPDGGLDYYNKAWFDYTGLTLAQTAEWDWGAVVHPDDLAHCVECWTRSLTTGENYEIEYRFKRGSDGTYRWFLGRAASRRNHAGEIVQWVGTCTDIEDKKRTESELLLARSELEQRVIERTAELALTNEQLQRQQTELRVLFDLMPAMIWFKDTENRILRVNQRVAEAAGKTIAEIEGKHSREIYPHDADKFYVDDLTVIHSSLPKLGYVENVRDPEGREAWVQTDKVPYFDQAGKVIGIVVMARDITASKQAGEALRKSEEHFSGAFEFASIGVALVSPEGRWLKVNRALCELLGYSAGELLTRTFQDVTYLEDLEKDLGYLRRTIAGEFRSYQMEKRYVHAHGHLVTVLLNVSLVRDEQDRPSYFISQIQDISERMKAEESLRLLGSAVEQSKESIMITEAELNLPGPRIVFVNPAFTRMTGYTAAEAIGKTPRLLQGPRTEKTVLSRLRLNLERGEAFAGETVNYRKDGTEFDLEWQIAPIKNPYGKTTHFVAIQRDISERKQATNALRESNDKFELLANHITDAFWIRSPDLKTVHYVSPAFEKIWGRSVKSLYANPQEWAQFILPEDRDRVAGAFDALTEDAPSLDIEYRIARPDGEVRWVHVRGFRVVGTAGKMISHTGIVTDITKRRQADEALRESEGRYRSLIENARDAIFTIAADGTFSSLNPAIETMAGLSRADWIGKPFAPMVHPDDLPLAVEMFQRIMQGGHVPVHELRGNPSLRRPALMEMTLAPLLDGSGKIIGVLGIGRDITERKQLEVQLYQSQKMESIGKLAGGVAHEFNSIMTAIIGQSELLLDDLPVRSGPYLKAAEIRDAANRAAILTQQLLAYGRKQQFQSAILDLNSVLAGMEGTLRNMLGRGVAMIIIPGARLNTVKADAAQIEQVIINMTVNADDAMPDGGILSFETTNVIPSRETANSSSEFKAGEYVMLAITDTGRGMTDAVKALIFEPFFTTKGTGEGSGLGLSTCQGIIKQSGGYISVSSEPGRGSTFKIYLPKATPQTTPPIPRLTSPGISSGKESVLLVESNLEIREMSMNFLKGLGYVVTAAADGTEALSADQQRAPGAIDLLLTDLAILPMGGNELLRQMRELFPHLKVLFTLSSTEKNVLEKDTSVLHKPFTPSALARKLREVLDHSSAS